MLKFMYVYSMQRRVKEARENARRRAQQYSLEGLQGIAASNFKIGLMYYRGDGIPVDKKEAAKYFKLAADQSQIAERKAIESVEKTLKTIDPDMSAETEKTSANKAEQMHAHDSVRPPKASKGGSLKRKFKKTRKHRH